MKLADKILEVEQDYKQFKLVTLGNYLPFKKIGPETDAKSLIAFLSSKISVI